MLLLLATGSGSKINVLKREREDQISVSMELLLLSRHFESGLACSVAEYEVGERMRTPGGYSVILVTGCANEARLFSC